MAELREKEKDKDYTLNLAQEILAKCHPDAVNVIKHWITIIQSRWDEVASWALQRRDKLDEHMKALRDGIRRHSIELLRKDLVPCQYSMDQIL